MKYKIVRCLFAVLLTATLANCEKKDDDDSLTNFALLASLSGGGDCSVAFPGKSAVAVNRTKVTKGGAATTVTWGRVPFVNHPIAIIEILGAQPGDSVVLNGKNVAEHPSNDGQPVVYKSENCPLAESTIIDGTTAFDVVPSYDPASTSATWTNRIGEAGSYYFLLYIAGGGEVATTVEYNESI